MNESNAPLRVAIDAPFGLNSGIGGVESVLIGLVRTLGRLHGPEEYIIAAPASSAEGWRPYLGPNQSVVALPPAPAVPPCKGQRLKGALGPLRPLARRTWRALFPPPLPVIRRSNGFFESLGCGVVHCPTQAFLRCAVPTVYNPHDLQHVHYPRYFTKRDLAWRENVYRTGCRESHTIAVASQWIKSDLVRCYGIAPSKIQVVPWAPPTAAYAEPTAELLSRVCAKFEIEPGFAFYPAMTWPHKNHIRLLEALASLRDQRGLYVRLVCTGAKVKGWPEIRERIASLRLERQVRFLGLVATGELRAIYRLARFVVVPTLFEAASGPMFEAWQERVPVACSTVTSLPEQAGDAALLFDPHSVEAIAGAIASMAEDSGLLADLTEKGARRLRDFDWERTAKAYRAVYRRAAGRPLSVEDRQLLEWDWMSAPREHAEVAK